MSFPFPRDPTTSVQQHGAAPLEHDAEFDRLDSASSQLTVLSPPDGCLTPERVPASLRAAEIDQIQAPVIVADASGCPEADIDSKSSAWFSHGFTHSPIWISDDLKTEPEEPPSLGSTCSSASVKEEPADMQLSYPSVVFDALDNDIESSWCGDAELLWFPDDSTAESFTDAWPTSSAMCGLDYIPGWGWQPPLPDSQSSVSNLESTSDASVAQNQHDCWCGSSFTTKKELEQHAKNKLHKPFVCNEGGCSARFARRDALLRHKIIHETSERPLYECSQCERYSGANAFKRRDHLVQHVEKVHPQLKDQILSPRYCTVSSCQFSKQHAHFTGFVSWKHQARHMRARHGEGRKDCKHPDCVQRARWFARKRDLQNHMKNVHHCGA